MGREINNFMENKKTKDVKEEFKEIFQCQNSDLGR